MTVNKLFTQKTLITMKQKLHSLARKAMLKILGRKKNTCLAAVALLSLFTFNVNAQTADCSCVNSSGNLLSNGSFENGTTGWTSVNGSFYNGTGYQVCGDKNGFLYATNGNAVVYQDKPVVEGSIVTFKGYSGTHTEGLNCSPKLSLLFFNSLGTKLSQLDVNVTKNVDQGTGLILTQYTLSGVAPLGTVKARVQGSINCNYLKVDAFCLTVVVPNLNLGNTVWYDANNDGIRQNTEVGLAGVTVNLYAAGNTTTIFKTTTTDVNGFYSFTNLLPGNYIVGVVTPSGYAQGSVGNTTPDNDIDNDNNGVTTVGTEVRSNAITLASGTEPAAGVDGDGTNGNLTLDFGLKALQISGNVFLDKDGLKDAGGGDINKSAGVSNTGTNAGSALYANLLNSAGKVVASTTVASNGTYLFSAVPVGTYTVQLTTNSSTGTYAIPVSAPATVLPSGWVNTGEFNGSTPGSDGSINGVSAAFTVSATTTNTNINFGIDRLPESVTQNKTIDKPALNSIISVSTLTGSDPEDQSATGSLAGKSIQITSLPFDPNITPSVTNAQLLYNGNTVTLNQIITNYDPTKLQIKFNIATAASASRFSFAYVDAAGFADPTPANYTVNWVSNGPLPISLVDFTATKQDKIVSLNWQTSTEQNSSYFDVEFSRDGTKFESIGRVAAAGNSSTVKNYSSTHQSPINGVNYYRLKLVDADGSFKFSAVRAVKFSTTKSITMMPNPTVDRVFITSNEGGVLQSVGLYSLNGKLLQQVNNFVLGKSIDLSTYAPSIYILKLTDKDGNTEVLKVVRK